MRDFLCKGYDKLYCFLGCAEMRLILGYESGGKGCARIFFYIRGAPPPISFHLSRPLHLQRLKSQHHGKSSWECPLPLIYPARGICSGVYHAFISFLSLGPLASPPWGYGFLSGSIRLRWARSRWCSYHLPRTSRRVSLSDLHGRQPSVPRQHAVASLGLSVK